MEGRMGMALTSMGWGMETGVGGSGRSMRRSTTDSCWSIHNWPYLHNMHGISETGAKGAGKHLLLGEPTGDQEVAYHIHIAHAS